MINQFAELAIFKYQWLGVVFSNKKNMQIKNKIQFPSFFFQSSMIIGSIEYAPLFKKNNKQHDNKMDLGVRIFFSV